MGCCSFIKKAFKKVRRAVKKVVKGVGKVAKKVWKGVKKVASKIGKAVTKMGPLASIALSMMMPGFGLTGIWGAMAKGAATGFITSGGSLKGALVGAAGGGIGYGITQGVSAFKTGYAGVSEGGSFYSKLEAGFDSVGQSTSDGVAQMYNSASEVLTTGDFSKLNYLDSTGNYVDPSKSNSGLFGDAPKAVPTATTGYQDALAEVEYDRATTDVGAKVHTRASQAYVNENPAEFGKRMTPTAQGRMMDASIADGEAGAIRQAKAFGYNENVGKSYYNEYTNGLTDEMGMSVKDQMIEIRDYSSLNKTGLGQGKELWSQTGGADVDASFDWDRRMATVAPDGVVEGTQAHDEWLANESTSPTGELYKSNYGLEATTEGGYNTFDANKLHANKPKKSWTDKLDPNAVANAFKKNFLSPDDEGAGSQALMSATAASILPGEGGVGTSKNRWGQGSDTYDVTKIGLLSAQQRMQMAQQANA